MRRILIYSLLSFIIITVVIVACRGAMHSDRLEEAHRLMTCDPDSALRLLSDIDSSTLRTDDDRMLFCLLLLEGADKTYQTHTDDRQISSLLTYFIEGENMKELHPEVNYYAGRVYSDLHQDAKALGYFKQALKGARQAGNLELEARTNVQMSYLYYDHRLYNHSSQHIKDAIKCSLVLHDTLNLINDGLTLADYYVEREETDSALHIYNHLRPLVDNGVDSITHTAYYTQLAIFYFYHGDPRVADSIINTVPIHYNDQTRSSVMCVLDKIRQGVEQKDPDEAFYLDLLNSSDPTYRFRASKYLAQLYGSRHDWKRMTDYLALAMENLRQIQHKYNDNSLVEMEKIIDEADLENENLRLSIQNHHRFLIILLCIGLLVVVGGATVMLVIRGRLRKTAYLLEIERLNTDNHREVARLEKEIAYLRSEEYESERTRSEEREAREAERDRKQKELERDLWLAMEQERITEMLSTGEDITEEDFVRLRAALSEVFPSFIEAIDGMDLRPQDYQDALLTRINIPQKVCAAFFSVTPQAVANARRRLWKKFDGGKVGKTWKEYIDSL